MACFVSLSFSIPLGAPLKEIYPKNSALCKLSRLETSKSAYNLPAISSSSRGMPSINRGYQHCLTAPLNLFGEIVSSCLDVSSCTRMIIAGYWVGPESDDGWGFVEAFVDGVTNLSNT